MLNPSKIVEFKNFSRLLSDFLVLFKANLIFKDLSRSPLNSSTFQACANLDIYGWHPEKPILLYENNKGADQSVHLRILVCTFVIRLLESSKSSLDSCELQYSS